MRVIIFVVTSFIFMGFTNSDICWWCFGNNCNECTSSEPPTFGDVDEDGSDGSGSWPSVCRKCTVIDWSYDLGAISTAGKSTLTKLSVPHWPEGTAWHSASGTCVANGIQSNNFPTNVTHGTYTGQYLGGGIVFAEYWIHFQVTFLGSSYAGRTLTYEHNFQYGPECY